MDSSEGLHGRRPTMLGDRFEVHRKEIIEIHRLFLVLPNPRSAKPRATDVNSSPVRIFRAPNRDSKMRRTAGTNEDPPVRNTRSTSRTSVPELDSSASTRSPI